MGTLSNVATDEHTLELQQEVRKLLGELKKSRTNYEMIWQRVIDLIFSLHRDIYFVNRHLIVNNALYDGSGMSALRTFAAGLVGNMSPRDQAWFTLRYRDPERNTQAGVQKWQKGIEDTIYSALDQSNFYEFTNEFTHEGGWACTAACYVEPVEKDMNVRFSVIPTGTYWIEENSKGEVDTMFRQIEMAGRDILKEWEDELPAYKVEQMKEAPFEKFKVIHCVRPRNDFDADDKLGNKNFEWESTFWLESDMTLLEESGYELFPFVVWRVRRSLVSPWGEGPGFDVIRDQTIMQRVAQDMLMADQKLIDPAYEVPEELSPREGREDPYNRDPGAINYMPMSAIGKSHPVQQLVQRPVGADREDRIRKQVEDHFFVPFFLMQNQVSHQVTIPEYMGRAAEQAVVLAPLSNRFSSEVLDPLMRLVVHHLDKFGLLPKPPAAVLQSGHPGTLGRAGRMDINYVGPLATLQKRSQTMTGIQSFIQSFGMLKQTMPEAAPDLDDNLDHDEIISLMAEANGVQVVLQSEDVKDNNRKARAQANAQAQQVQQQAQQAALAEQQAKAQTAQATRAMSRQPTVPGNMGGAPVQGQPGTGGAW